MITKVIPGHLFSHSCYRPTQHGDKLGVVNVERVRCAGLKVHTPKRCRLAQEVGYRDGNPVPFVSLHGSKCGRKIAIIDLDDVTDSTSVRSCQTNIECLGRRCFLEQDGERTGSADESPARLQLHASQYCCWTDVEPIVLPRVFMPP